MELLHCKHSVYAHGRVCSRIKPKKAIRNALMWKGIPIGLNKSATRQYQMQSLNCASKINLQMINH